MTTNATMETMLAKYQIDDSDQETISSLAPIATRSISAWREEWYGWLETQPEFNEFFADSNVLEMVQKASSGYWIEFFECDLGQGYFDSRQLIGEVHARIGLPLPVYLAGMNMSYQVFLEKLFQPELTKEQYAQALQSCSKLLHLDTDIVVQTYVDRSNQALEAQNRLLNDMSTPVTNIWEGVLFLPLVGIIDSRRARDIMTNSLEAIAESRAAQFIMDISGVAVVDTAVANYLVRITRATSLMGCETTISGVSPAIAQTIVELGIDVAGVKTTSTMQDALAGAVKILNE